MKNKKINLEHELLIEKFIFTFFEPTSTKRKNSGNELDYISKTLDRVFKKNFGFNIDRVIIEKKIVKLGFQTFQKNETYNSDTKKHSPSVNGEIIAKLVGMDFHFEAPYTYFDIDPTTVRQLMRTTAKLPVTTNITKYHETESMQKRINEFKSNL